MEHPLWVARGRGAPPSLDDSNRPIWSAWACIDCPPLPINKRTFSLTNWRGPIDTGWCSPDDSRSLRAATGVQTEAFLLHVRDARRPDVRNCGSHHRESAS